MTRTILITGCSTGIGWTCALGMKARGWRVFATARKPEDLARLAAEGVEAIIYTDIGRDGMMTGVNIEATARLARAIHIPVIASGGITSLDDIQALSEIVGDGVMGAITGRAIYEGSLDFAEGLKLAESF